MHSIFPTVLAILSLAIHQGWAQQTIGCYVEGECQESLYLDAIPTDKTVNCHQFCKDTPGCQYFVHKIDEGLCFAYANCVDFDQSSCPDCVSGDVGCDFEFPQCFVGGRCQGSLVDYISDVDTGFDCLEECKKSSKCEWWTWDDLDKVCFLTSDCPRIESCDTCVLGESQCVDYIYDKCGADILSFSGLIQSPGYPSGYPIEIVCDWVIEVPSKDATVGLKFIDLDIEESISCDYDKVVLYDGRNTLSPEIATLCGNDLPDEMYNSTGRFMTVSFSTDYSDDGRGFQAGFVQN